MHNCCVDLASRIVKWNVNKGSNACKSLLTRGAAIVVFLVWCYPQMDQTLKTSIH